MNTKWLSLERATYVISKPITEIYLVFYQSALQAFVNFNKFLQREDLYFCKQMKMNLLSKFVNKLASKFVLAAKIKAANKDFLNLQCKVKEHQHLGINLR